MNNVRSYDWEFDLGPWSIWINSGGVSDYVATVH